MPIRVLCVFILFICTGSVAAQTQNNDYRAAKTDSRLARLLSNVERYHLEPGITQLRTKQVDGVRTNAYLSHAWGHFRFVLNYFPNHPRALMLTAEVCAIWKDPKKCDLDSAFRDALQINDQDALIHLVKAIYLQKNRRMPEAIEAYKRSLEIDPDSANAHYNLALAYLAQRQNTLANEHAQRAYALGMMLPGLQNKLIEKNAWKPIEPKPVTEPTVPAETATPVSDRATPKPLESETKPNHGGK